MEDERKDTKDHSRPFFARKPGEVGIYVDVDEVVVADVHAYGSEHLKMIDMNAKLEEKMSACNLIKVKGEMEKRGFFRDVILEEFRHGNILSVTFDTSSALEELWKQYENKALSLLFQSIFVDKSLLNALGVRKLSVRVRMWKDEIDACREEITKLKQEKIDIETRSRDVDILKQVLEFQKTFSQKVVDARSMEGDFEMHLSEFLLAVKKALPEKVDKVANLKEFQTNMTVAMGTNVSGMQHIKNYLSTLEFLRTMLMQVEVNICVPLSLIPARCETERQRDLKAYIRSTCAEMLKLLKTTNSLREPNFKEWEGKVLPREKTMFMGLISLVPLGFEKVSDIDHNLDEYIRYFPLSVQHSLRN